MGLLQLKQGQCRGGGVSVMSSMLVQWPREGRRLSRQRAIEDFLSLTHSWWFPCKSGAKLMTDVILDIPSAADSQNAVKIKCLRTNC